jgi:hypothetical protein
VHLAVAAEQASDGPVVISEADPQGSTVDCSTNLWEIHYSGQPHHVFFGRGDDR